MGLQRPAIAVIGTALALGVAAAPVVAEPPGPATPGPAASAAPFVLRAADGDLQTISAVPGGLTKASTKAPADLALAFARGRAADFGVRRGAEDTLYVATSLKLTTGATAVHLGQRVDGLRVRGAALAVVVAKDGRIMSAAGDLVAGTGRAASPRLTAAQALDAAAAKQGAKKRGQAKGADVRSAERRTFPNVYGVGTSAERDVITELVWHPSADGNRLRLAWLTDIESSGQEWWESVVDAGSGAILDRTSRYAHAGPEGTVFTGQNPEVVGNTTRQVVPLSGLDGSWVSGNTTSGNNVNAYLDRNDDDANNEYQPVADDQHFNYAFTDAWNTTNDVTSLAALDADRDASLTQLFYYTNVLHDWLYGHGFDEASGNFQVDNFGRGGAGNDPVLAEGQDGWDFGCVDDKDTDDPGDDEAIRCLNNANFGTPADGSSPRMQMYMWTSPHRDGNFDGDVIAHEYGHGVSSRLVGGGNLGYSGADQRGALGEGWSDIVSYLKWGDAVIAEYDTGNAATGIRSVAYDTSTLDFQDYNVNAGSGHGPGQIWATVVYDIRKLYPGGVEATADLVLDGMKATPANPTFIDARDGLITADGGANRCLIWSAFAGRGLGTGSTTGLDTVPTESDDVPAECLPTADAGGPYATPEGTDVAVSGAGSAAGSDPSAGAVTTYEWDLDNDGQYDDATGVSPDFTRVGQDGSYTIGLRVTDAFGNTDTDTGTVNVSNVAPTATVDAITPLDEYDVVTITGTVTDPGWLDPLTATITFDDGAAPVNVVGTIENTRPNATFSFSVEHQYGDNGSYTVQVCPTDDDGPGTCGSTVASVANLDPTAEIDTAGEQVYDGVSAFILEAGEDLTVPVGSQDWGSDDLLFEWTWGDGATSSETSLVNPPDPDPAKSPSVEPREETLSSTHTYGEACANSLGVSVTDDDGGSASDSAIVIVTGNADVSKGHGWWLNQYRDKAPNDFSAAELQCYLDIVGTLSMVFDEETDASTRAKATKVLNAPAKAPAMVIFDQHLLGAWLNFANGSVKLDTPVDTDGDGVADSTFGATVLAAETVRIDPSATEAQIKVQKGIIERIAVQSAS